MTCSQTVPVHQFLCNITPRVTSWMNAPRQVHNSWSAFRTRLGVDITSRLFERRRRSLDVFSTSLGAGKDKFSTDLVKTGPGLHTERVVESFLVSEVCPPNQLSLCVVFFETNKSSAKPNVFNLKPWPNRLASRRKFAKPELACGLARGSQTYLSARTFSQKAVHFTHIQMACDQPLVSTCVGRPNS